MLSEVHARSLFVYSVGLPGSVNVGLPFSRSFSISVGVIASMKTKPPMSVNHVELKFEGIMSHICGRIRPQLSYRLQASLLRTNAQL